MATPTKYELKLGPATREAFGAALVELGATNPDVVVLDADLSKSTYTAEFGKKYPERFFECGIAESNMVAIGAGLGYGGKIPFVSSFSAFLLNKGFEQLRVTAAMPTLSLLLTAHKASSDATSASTSRLLCSRDPKRMLALTSRSRITVSSRSST